MDFLILGPVEVLDHEGRPLEVPRGRPQSLLALLLVNGDQVIPADRVIEELWRDKLPANPHNAVQVVASRLRKALGSDVILSKAGGYALRLEAGARDSDRFEELVARAEPGSRPEMPPAPPRLSEGG